MTGGTGDAGTRGSVPAGTRATDASMSLTGDALAIDDRRWVHASLRDDVRVLLVDGDPRTVRHDDELFYLQAALRLNEGRIQATANTAGLSRRTLLRKLKKHGLDKRDYTGG